MKKKIINLFDKKKKNNNRSNLTTNNSDLINNNIVKSTNDLFNEYDGNYTYSLFKKACDEDNYIDVKKYINFVTEENLNSEFLELCKNDEHELINIILSESTKISKEIKYQALVICCKYGYIYLIERLLITGLDIKKNDHEALKVACSNNRIEAVKLIVRYYD